MFVLSRDSSVQGEEFIRSVLKQTLLALVALHARNITHRDVKPENLLLSEAGNEDDGALEPQSTLLVAELTSPPPPASGVHASPLHLWRTVLWERVAGAAPRPCRYPRVSLSQPDSHPLRTGGQAAGSSAPFNAPHVRLIDFGSALDEETVATMYGTDGPSAAEQTPEYAPPEAMFASRWPGPRTVRRHLNPSHNPTTTH